MNRHQFENVMTMATVFKEVGHLVAAVSSLHVDLGTGQWAVGVYDETPTVAIVLRPQYDQNPLGTDVPIDERHYPDKWQAGDVLITFDNLECCQVLKRFVDMAEAELIKRKELGV